MDLQDHIEEEARARRMQRIKKMQEEKQRQMMLRQKASQAAPFAVAFVLLILVVWAGSALIGHRAGSAGEDSDSQGQKEIVSDDESIAVNDSIPVNDSNVINPETDLTDLAEPEISGEEFAHELPYTEGLVSLKNYRAAATKDTLSLGDEIISSYAVLIDLNSNNILAGKGADEIISPASMTKILTVLVAAECLGDMERLDDTFTITLDITDYGFVHDCSSAGFLADETVTVRDLFYGTILPSGADAAVALATYIAGSQEAFVELMNEKLDQMGLSDTAHMTNCVGIYEEDHYCTVYDIAMILEAAIDNDLCREVLAAHTYNTSKTEQHPDGIIISNWFLRRIEDRDTGGEVVCGKTGFVAQSGSCAASYGVDRGGKEYICVTADAISQWKCIADHVTLYKQFAGGEIVAKSEQNRGREEG